MAERVPRVLVVEDDTNMGYALEVALSAAGYRVRLETSSQAAEHAAATFLPDLALLDVGFPDGPDGFSLARRLRARAPFPLIFLTGRDAVVDRLAGFEAGADDYLVKPFAMPELLARVRAVLSRATVDHPLTMTVGDLVIDEAGHRVARHGAPIDLRPLEFRLLCALAAEPGRVLSKSQLYTAVWGVDPEYGADDNLVEVHISTLRRKLEEHGPRLLHTVRGMGYVLRP